MLLLPDLYGDLVVLRQLNIERDLIGYFNVSLDENIHLWVGNNTPKDIDEIKVLLNIYVENMYVWTIFDNRNSKIIGIMRLSYPEFINGKLTSGDSQRLLSSYWRKGYMKEARKLLYFFAYKNLNIEMLVADVWEGNTNSLESLKSVGYQINERRLEYFKKIDALVFKLYLQLDLESWYKINVLNGDKE